MDTKPYTPTGNLQGDSRAMPDRGISTGVTDSYGANLSTDATNRQGSMGANSDPMDECCASEQKSRG